MQHRELEELFRRSGAALAITDPDGRITAANHALARLVGRSLDDLVGTRLGDLVHPGDPVLGVGAGAHAGPIPDVEKRYVRSDGTVVWVRTGGEVVPDDQGRPSFVVRHMVDITDRKAAEERAAATLAQQRATVELGRFALGGAGEQEVIERAVAVVAEHLPVQRVVVMEVPPERHEARIRSCAGVTLPGDEAGVAPVSEQIRHILAAGDAVVTIDLTEESRFPADPRLRDAGMRSATATAIRVGGRPWGLLGAASRTVATYSADDRVFLDGVASVVAGAIARRRQDEAEAAAAAQGRLGAVGALAAGLAHDLGNALAVVKAEAELLQRRPEFSADVHHHAAIIEVSADRMADVVERILDMSRTGVVAPRRLDLRTAVDHVVPVLDRIVRQDVRVQLDPGSQPCSAVVDLRSLHHSLINLVRNAADAMPEGGTVTLRVGCTGDGGASVWVTDTGTGMTDDVLRRAFEPFFTTKQSTGTGLGLPRVRTLMEQQGGRVEVHTAVGKGTSFSLWFPGADCDC